MKTILWKSNKIQATDELKEYLDKLVQEYDVVTIVPTFYTGMYSPVIQSAIIIVKEKK